MLRYLCNICICSYSDIIIEREVLMQKYIHLVQIVETEKVAANQLRTPAGGSGHGDREAQSRGAAHTH